MPRYSLRTLMILLAIGPPALAGVWLCWPALESLPWFFIIFFVLNLPFELWSWMSSEQGIVSTATIIFLAVVFYAVKWLFRDRAATPS